MIKSVSTFVAKRQQQQMFENIFSLIFFNCLFGLIDNFFFTLILKQKKSFFYSTSSQQQRLMEPRCRHIMMIFLTIFSLLVFSSTLFLRAYFAIFFLNVSTIFSCTIVEIIIHPLACDENYHKEIFSAKKWGSLQLLKRSTRE